MQVEEYERESMQREKLMAEISVDKESLKQEVELLTFQVQSAYVPTYIYSMCVCVCMIRPQCVCTARCVCLLYHFVLDKGLYLVLAVLL